MIGQAIDPTPSFLQDGALQALNSSFWLKIKRLHLISEFAFLFIHLRFFLDCLTVYWYICLLIKDLCLSFVCFLFRIKIFEKSLCSLFVLSLLNSILGSFLRFWTRSRMDRHQSGKQFGLLGAAWSRSGLLTRISRAMSNFWS